jgi:hypothetical protein
MERPIRLDLFDCPVQHSVKLPRRCGDCRSVRLAVVKARSRRPRERFVERRAE